MTDHPIPDDLVDTMALAMSDQWNTTMATGPRDATIPEEWEDAAQAALEALTAYADGALIDPDGWKRLDAKHMCDGDWDEDDEGAVAAFCCNWDLYDDPRDMPPGASLYTLVERGER